MAEETLATPAENPEEGLAQGPAETRVHPREIMGEALPKPVRPITSSNKTTPKVQPVLLKPQPANDNTGVLHLEETLPSERALVFKILSGSSSADTQTALTSARRRSGVGTASDMNARMKKVAKEALRTS